jgi:predicted dehydrogenase
MTHWIDVVHWYMDVDAPLSATATGRNYNIKLWEAPDTVTATLEFPKNFITAYLGTYVSKVDDGGLEFRGDRGTLKIDRARLAFYRDDASYAPGTLAPEPDIYVRSSGDGTLSHLQNWLDCIRSRKAPNAHIRVGHQAARTSHIANAALQSGRLMRWNNATAALEG